MRNLLSPLSAFHADAVPSLHHVLRQISVPFSTGLETFPLYDVESLGDHAVVISLAVPGFTKTELSITAVDDVLKVAGHPAAEDTSEDATSEHPARGWLYRSIVRHPFHGSFRIPHMDVTAVVLDKGILRITLERLDKQPRTRSFTVEEATSDPGISPEAVASPQV